MRSILLAVVFTSAALAPTARAQEVQILNSATQTLVTYTLRASVPNADGASGVVSRLSDDPHLARLNVASRARAEHSLEAVFVFGSVAEYVEWHASAGTAGWMRDLEADSIRAVEATVSVRRRALERFLPEAD